MCPRCGWIPRPLLIFDADGRLDSIESDANKLDGRAGVAFFSGLLIPGFAAAASPEEVRAVFDGVRSLALRQPEIPLAEQFARYSRTAGHLWHPFTPGTRPGAWLIEPFDWMARSLTSDSTVRILVAAG